VHTAAAQEAGAQADEAREAQRQRILQSDRWRRMQLEFHKWLEIQQIYSPEQVTEIQAEIARRIAGMSPEELLRFLDDSEERLRVLLSADADEAREWIAGILAVARDPESQFGGPLPDVATMTADEIRAELEQFQQRRASRQQAHASFNRGRQTQVQAARDAQAARRGGAAQPRAAATFVEPSYRSPYAIERRRPLEANTGRVVYRVGPWGEPIYWNPLADWRVWRGDLQ
jgi:hypothetical protein